MCCVQERVRALEQSLQRNRGNQQLATRITATLEGARKELVIAQGEHARVSKAITQGESQKRWLKF